MTDEEPKHVHRGLKKGLYVIPTAFTAANIGMGFLAVLYSIRAFQAVLRSLAAASYFNSHDRYRPRYPIRYPRGRVPACEPRLSLAFS